jgi:hypothetical protein
MTKAYEAHFRIKRNIWMLGYGDSRVRVASNHLIECRRVYAIFASKWT